VVAAQQQQGGEVEKTAAESREEHPHPSTPARRQSAVLHVPETSTLL
jgi:hypothetical protein